MSQLLDGKVAVITGGGRGIGEASARRLAEHGAKVILADMDLPSAQAVADDLCAKGCEAKALEFNVAEFEKIPEKVAQARALFGRIDILVNVAGIAGSTPIEEITLESWDRMMDIDLKSMFFVTQAVFAIMKEQGYGKLVHMSSLAALRGGRSSDASYACAKAGILNLSKLRTAGRALPYHLQRCLPRQYPHPHGQDPLLVQGGSQDLYPPGPVWHCGGYRQCRAVLRQ